MSIKKSIGWCDITRNPIKGRCEGGCWYCYYSGKRGMLNRFNHDSEIRFKPSVLLDLPKKSKKIFLCSTHDLFGSWIPSSWRDVLFDIWIPNNPQHIFQILTKFPENIDRPIPDNVWLGVTVECGEMTEAYHWLKKAKANFKFISVEPYFTHFMPVYLPEDFKIDWLIIGRLTGYGKKYDPHKSFIEDLVEEAKFKDIPVFLKDNLKDIWGEPLIQEIPE